jgi:hypothetical protein
MLPLWAEFNVKLLMISLKVGYSKPFVYIPPIYNMSSELARLPKNRFLNAEKNKTT